MGYPDTPMDRLGDRTVLRLAVRSGCHDFSKVRYVALSHLLTPGAEFRSSPAGAPRHSGRFNFCRNAL